MKHNQLEISRSIEERYQRQINDLSVARIINRRNAKRVASSYPDILSKIGKINTKLEWQECFEDPSFIHSFVAAAEQAEHYDEILDLAKHINEADVNEFVGDVNSYNSQKLNIVFVSCVPYFTILREAKALAIKGYRVSLISLNPLQEKLKSAFDEVFDNRIDCMNSWGEMARIVASLNVDVFHVQCRQSEYGIARLVNEAKQTGVCICELYDIASTQGERDTIREAFRLQDVEYDFAMEEYIFLNVDAIVHRISSDVFKEVQSKYSSTTENLTFYPYSTNPVINADLVKPLSQEREIRLVYTGSVHPIDEDHKGSPIAQMIETFESLLKQGFYVDLLFDPNLPLNKNMEGYEPYYKLEEKYHNFKICPGVSPSELPRRICEYHFGIALTDIPKEQAIKMRKLLTGAVGTKLFGYLEAGLPVLWSAEWEFSSSYLEKYKVGFGVTYNQRRNLKSFLDEIDYPSLRQSVNKYNAIYNMDNQIAELIRLYNKVFQKKIKLEQK